MKFKFKIQEYQTEAVKNILAVFEGQPYKDRVTYLHDLGNVQSVQMGLDDDTEGFRNGDIELSDGQLLSNIHDIQVKNNIKQSDELSPTFRKGGCRCSLDIDMETGTGKTYVYIKSIFELSKKYGWNKYIIVVPSIAIREGVKKSFEQLEDHFFDTYGKKIRYFIYNSRNLTPLDDFSTSSDISVMIINSQAFAVSFKEDAKNEAARIIFNPQDSFQSRRPIDVIAANRPIVILDEPQKLGGSATQK
ncbi:MAG: DEAD/DEAH box helicase family protein, partial [Bacteroidales bacterium]|nr:DEAD/DEAH box helicase family protein [Bacteroidales bacterium]